MDLIDAMTAFTPVAPSLRIGLTGGIGSGKSTVALMLREAGATIVDTDAIARELTATGGAAMPALAHIFGPSIIAGDGSLNRERMRELAFADGSIKAKLEAVLHPLIGRQAQIQAAAAHSGAVVFDVPLLAESSAWRARVDRVLVVDCDEGTQVDRVARRPGWTADAARAVIAQQASRSQRRAMADAVIHNDGISLDTLQSEVQAVWARWKAH
jgi:dephospho-CoA kinase